MYTFPFGPHPAFTKVDATLLFLVFLLFGINLILLAILISIFFNRSSIAIISAILFYAVVDLAQHFIDPKYNKGLSPELPALATIQIIFCLLPAPAIKFAMRVFTYLVSL